MRRKRKEILVKLQNTNLVSTALKIPHKMQKYYHKQIPTAVRYKILNLHSSIVNLIRSQIDKMSIHFKDNTITYNKRLEDNVNKCKEN